MNDFAKLEADQAVHREYENFRRASVKGNLREAHAITRRIAVAEQRRRELGPFGFRLA